MKAIVAGCCGWRGHGSSGETSRRCQLVDVLWTWALDYRCANAARLFAPSTGSAGTAATGDGLVDRGGDRDADHRMQLMTAAARLAAQNGCCHRCVPSYRRYLPSRYSTRIFRASRSAFWQRWIMLAALAQAASAGRGSSWAENVQCAIRALVGQLASDPVLAQLAFVEVSLGPAGVMIKERLMAAAVRMLLLARRPVYARSQLHPKPRSAPCGVDAALHRPR